ncbi:MAG: hypothetical protein B6D59_05740 [Campylobacteraceae bacterium 4484_4]|nr:MAG: hypothetical protein B6D59_05740 [Campylobacteraceae bacterium 4484_4]
MQKIRTTPSVVIRILLWVVMLAGGTAGGIWLDLHHFRRLVFDPLFHLLTLGVGIWLMILAFRAAAVGGRELAKHGKEGDIPRLETNRLVCTGIYAKMRHPMLFGLTLVPLALAFMIGSPSFIIWIAPAEMLFIVVMVLTFEERECRKKFGADYDAYASQTPPVCFRPECLKALFGRKKAR